jgi:hypothetical protein
LEIGVSIGLPGSSYVEKQVASWTIYVFKRKSDYYFYSTGKAEAGSAGEQPARNSLFDWNGQRGCSNLLQPLFIHNIPRVHAFQKLIYVFQ